MTARKEIRSYEHDVDTEAETPDSKPGDYYVSIVDRSSNAGGGRYAFALGPFRNDHAAALARVREVRRYVSKNYSRGHWLGFGTARIDASDENPVGKLNETLGFPAPTAKEAE